MHYIVTEYKELGKGRVELCLNESIRFCLYRKEASAFHLKEASKLTEEEYQQLIHEVIGKRATKRAMHILERQERTEYQLREKLLQNGYPEESIEDAIDYVKHYHYVDDLRYAKTFIRYHQEKRSRRRLYNDLRQKGISTDVITRSLEEEFSSDERQQIMDLIEKKGFSADTADQKEYRKMYQFLMRGGVKSADIMAVMRYSSQAYCEL